MKPHIKYRQRFFYLGIAMGRFGAVRRMLNQALAQAPQDTNFGSYQCGSSNNLGDQKIYREILRRDYGLALGEGLNVTHIKEVWM